MLIRRTPETQWCSLFPLLTFVLLSAVSASVESLLPASESVPAEVSASENISSASTVDAGVCCTSFVQAVVVTNTSSQY